MTLPGLGTPGAWPCLTLRQGVEQGGAPSELLEADRGRSQGRSGARMRGRLCVGRAAAVAAAVAVPLAGGQEGSPGGVRRGSRGTTMVKKRKGRVVIDSDTEDSGSDENLDQVGARPRRRGPAEREAESGPRDRSRQGPEPSGPSA